MTRIDKIILINYRRLVEGCGRQYFELDIPKMNTIIIMGENGIGKSSLLSQLNLLPPISSDGYEFIKGEIGEKTVYFTSDDVKYKVTYICKPKKDTFTCSGDLSKIVDGKQVQIVQSSSITEIVSAIKNICGMDTKLLKISSLSVDDRGLVSMKTSERREFLNSLSPIGDTKELIKTITEKYIFYKKSRESNSLKLDNMPSSSTLYGDKKNYEMMLDVLEAKSKEFMKPDIMEDSKYEAYKKEILDYNNIIIDLTEAKSILGDSTNTIKNASERYITSIAKLESKRDDLVRRISDNSSEIAKYKMRSTIDYDDLLEQCENHEFNRIAKGNRYLKSESELVLANTLIDLIHDTMNEINSISFFNRSELMNEDPTMDILELEKELSNKQIRLNILERTKTDNYVPDDITCEPSKNCIDTSCPLRQEFDKMIGRLEVYNKAVDDIKKVNIEIEDIESRLTRLYGLRDAKTLISRMITKLSSSYNILSVVSPLLKSENDILRNIKDGCAFNFIDLMKEINYNTKLYLSYMEKKKLLEDSSDSSKIIKELSSSIEIMNKELINTNELLDKEREESKSIIKYSGAFSHLFKYEIEEKITEYITKKIQVEEIIASEDEKRMKLSTLKESLDKIEEEIKTIKAQLDKTNFDIKFREVLLEDLDKAIKGEADTLKIRETLTKHLPIRIMRRILLNLKEISNSLLEVTDMAYRIHDFEITATSFTIAVQKGSVVNSDVSKMSDGERAIMSLATMLALNIILLPNYATITLDEIDATLSIENKKKFIAILSQFSRLKDTQIFTISHNEYHGIDSNNIGYLEINRTGKLEVLPFLK